MGSMLFHEGCDGITWNKKAPFLLLFLQKRLYLCRRKSNKRCFRGVLSPNEQIITQAPCVFLSPNERKEIRRKGWLLPAKAFLLFLSFDLRSSDVTIRDSLCKHGSPLTAPSVQRDKYKLFYDFCFNFERSDQLIAPTKGYKLSIYEYDK